MVIENPPGQGPIIPEPQSNIVLSLIDEYVWASWPGSVASVRLGRHDAVLRVMRDFLAQSALGESLSGRRHPKESSPDVGPE